MRLLPLTLLAFLGGVPLSAQDSPSERPNVLLICVDDLRPELGCFGLDYVDSPHIDSLAERGRLFRRHFVQAPTCGASRHTLLTGRYGPIGNDALFSRAKAMGDKEIPPTMPAWFRQQGYTTVSVGKVSHHPGGRGGPDWDDGSIPEMPLSWDRHLQPIGSWQHPRGIMHGLAHGEIRGKAKDMDVQQSEPGGDEIYPDGLTIDESLVQLEELAAADDPFFLAVGILRPHLPFGAPAKYMKPYVDAVLPETPHPEKPEGKTTWHGSAEFMKYQRWDRDPNTDAEFALEVRKHYAACVSYADALVGRLLAKLKETGVADNTVIVLWGDHGWHLGEHAVWGKHTLFEESLHSPLIVVAPETESAGTPSDAMVETVDIFPTLCELAGLKMPSFAHGRSLVPALKDPATEGRPAFGYHKTGLTLRDETHRLITANGEPRELYDHRSDAGETVNVLADQPEVASALLKQLQERDAQREAVGY